MEDERFDALTRSLASSGSRRATVRWLGVPALGSVIALLGMREVRATHGTCGHPGDRCGRDRLPCCSGVCKGRKKRKTCRCPQRNCCACRSATGESLSCELVPSGFDSTECRERCIARHGIDSFDHKNPGPGSTTACGVDGLCAFVDCEP